jgi:hypothetical protein
MNLSLEQQLHQIILQFVREQYNTREIREALMHEYNRLSAFKEYEQALEDARMSPK